MDKMVPSVPSNNTMPSEIGSYPFEKLDIYYAGPFPNGKYILLIITHTTKILSLSKAR